MFKRNILILATILISLSVFAEKTAKNAGLSNSIPFAQLKKEVTDFLLKKQRNLAVQKIENSLEKLNTADKNKAFLLKQNIMTYFLSLKTQEAYEISTGQLMSNKKNSYKNLQLCLIEEPDNLYCLWQDLKYSKMYESGDFQEKVDKFITTTEGLPEFYEMSESLKKESSNIVNIEKSLKSGLFEKEILAALLVYRNAIQNKDYVKAQEMVKKIEKTAPDYPEHIFMSYQLKILTQADQKNLKESYLVYRKICSDLTVSTVSKYYFDIDLCLRGLN